MTKAIIAGLLLVATSAHADHVWRLWCGTPLTERTGVWDSQHECQDHAWVMGDLPKYVCVDTKDGPRWRGWWCYPISAHPDCASGEVSDDWRQFRNCAEVQREQTCECRPELVK
jgi:hypothetical protein